MGHLRASIVCVLAVAGVVCLVPATAAAQRGVDVDTFHPALDSYGIFTVERSQTAAQWGFGFKLFANYAANPLRLAMFDAAAMAPRRVAIIDRQLALDFGANLGLTRWLELALDVPLSSQSYGDAYGHTGSAADPTVTRTGFYAADRFTNVPPPDGGPLDARVALKARVVHAGPFGLALAAIVTVPFGDETAFLGDSNFTFRPLLIGDVTRGSLTVAVNVGAIVRQRTRVLDPYDLATLAPSPRVLLELGDELTYSIGAAWRVARLVGVAAELYGYEPLAVSRDAVNDRTIDVLGGVQLFPLKSLAIAVGAGAGVIGTAARHDDFRVFFGITWSPVDAKGGLAGSGVDSDGDGIPDAQDLCPAQAEDKDGFDDEDGCPDPDNDADGIPDALDKCPNEPEDKDGFQDEDGCPELDNDADGIPDAQDKCPNEPEDRDGFQDEDGCPNLDNDGDGIADAQDNCPNEPETFNGVDDADGCPDSGGAVQIAGNKIELPDSISFDTGRATIARRSEALLGRVADKINANPRVRRVRIEGHTDDVGSAKKNQELSQERAEAVRDFLIRKGVDPDRLQAVGFGNTRPLETHRNAEARAKNRRVDFIIVEQ